METNVDVVKHCIRERCAVVEQPCQVLHQVENHHYDAKNPKHEPKGSQKFSHDVAVETGHGLDALSQLNHHSIFPFAKCASQDLRPCLAHEIEVKTQVVY